MKPVTTDGSPPTGLSFFSLTFPRARGWREGNYKYSFREQLVILRKSINILGKQHGINILPHRKYELYCIILCHDLQLYVMLEMLHHFFKLIFRNHWKRNSPFGWKMCGECMDAPSFFPSPGPGNHGPSITLTKEWKCSPAWYPWKVPSQIHLPGQTNQGRQMST